MEPGRKILLVEDHADTAKPMAQLLRLIGMKWSLPTAISRR